MILTLLCQMLLLDTGIIAFPQESSRSTSLSRSPQFSLASPSPSTRDANVASVTSDLAFRPRSGSDSRSINSSSHSAPINYNNNGQVRQFKSSMLSSSSISRSQPAFTRRRRDPKTRPQSSDWLIPPYNPTTRRPRASYITNTNSYGLAYRSILPIRNSNVNHYTGLYRNRNLFSNGQNNENDDYNFNYNGNNHEYETISPQEKNDINVNLGSDSGTGENGHDVNINLPLKPFTTTSTTTTAESKTKSAPATEAGSVSSTVEMKDDFGVAGTGHVALRDDIGVGGVNEFNSDATQVVPKNRQPKLHKIAAEDDQDTSIVFPGSVYRPPNKRPVSVRPGKATSTSNVHSDDDYVPPPLKALDKAAFESLKMLLETRRISQNLNSRTSDPKIDSGSSGRPNPTPTPTSPLDIKGRPKCASQNNGYCDEIDTYPKEFFNQVLQNSLTLTPQVFQEVFGDSVDNKTVASDLAGRDGLNLMLDSPLCSSIEHTIYPKVAENKDGKFMYIVNHDEYIQGVRVEKCVKEGSPCMYLEGSLTGYQSTCRQKYIYRKLLAFTKDGKATTDTFRLPACCVCHVRSVYIDDRINTAGFGPDSDYTPSSIVMPKKNAVNSTQGDPYNVTAVENNDQRLSDMSTATEMVHDDVMDFPTIIPDSIIDYPKNGTSETEGVTEDSLIEFRAF